MISENSNNIITDIETYKNDFIQFIEKVCNIKLLPYQKIILRQYADARYNNKELYISMPMHLGMNTIKNLLSKF